MALQVQLLSAKLQNLVFTLAAQRSMVESTRAMAAASNLDAETVRRLLGQLRRDRAFLATIPRTAKVANLAIQELDYSGNLASDFSAVESAMDALGGEIVSRAGVLWANYAIDSTTWTETIPVWSSAQTASFQSAAEALIEAIDTFAGHIGDV